MGDRDKTHGGNGAGPVDDVGPAEDGEVSTEDQAMGQATGQPMGQTGGDPVADPTASHGEDLGAGASAPTAAQGQPAPQLPLFYAVPEPLTVQGFAGKGLRSPGDFHFAAKAHAVVLHTQEFRFAAAHYPIVFSDDAAAMPLAVLGYRAGQNLFVDADGAWAEGAYVPAYVRRYPFVTGQGNTPEEPILYLDAASDLVVDLPTEAGAEPTAEATGVDPLFVDGAPGERVKQALEFCAAFQQQVPLTQGFVEAVQEQGLLETKEIRLTLPDGQQQVLTGLRVVEEARFSALPDEVFLDWRKRGWIAAVYWHWASMDNFQRLVKRG